MDRNAFHWHLETHCDFRGAQAMASRITDLHAECIRDMVEELVSALFFLKYRERFQTITRAERRIVLFHPSGEELTIIVSECRCESGNAELRAQVAMLN